MAILQHRATLTLSLTLDISLGRSPTVPELYPNLHTHCSPEHACANLPRVCTAFSPLRLGRLPSAPSIAMRLLSPPIQRRFQRAQLHPTAL
eukprot:6189928-Pleurochrysis_carterae.AAC.1